MHRLDINEKETEYVVTFEIPGINEDHILIKCENNSLNVIAVTTTVTKELKEGIINIDQKSIVYNKTVILENVDFSRLKSTFFLGWLEVIVPKN